MFKINLTNFQKLTKSFEKNFEKKLTNIFGLLESSRVHRHPTWYNRKNVWKNLTKHFLKKFDKKFLEKIWQSFFLIFWKKLTKLFGLLESSRVHEHPTWYNRKYLKKLTKNWQKLIKKVLKKIWQNFLDSSSHRECIDTLHDIIKKCSK
jgi:hypothetical protein